jgi:hypothetical protein
MYPLLLQTAVRAQLAAFRCARAQAGAVVQLTSRVVKHLAPKVAKSASVLVQAAVAAAVTSPCRLAAQPILLPVADQFRSLGEVALAAVAAAAM